MEKKKVLILIIGIIVGICIAIALLLGIRQTSYYTMIFNKLTFHTPLELEEVVYVNSDFLEEEVVYTDAEELKYWEGILNQLNNAEFTKGASLRGSGYGKHTITFKFKDSETKLEVAYAGEQMIRMFGYNWSTTDEFSIDEETLLQNVSK
ncbi:MAG: hypothetical protein IJ419_07560 [Agathobacter sp.]|nr:hypothetical protein [Agathobacter sp.]